MRGVSTQVTSLLVPQIHEVGGVSTQVTSLLVSQIPQVQQPQVTQLPLGQIAQLGVPNQVVAQDQVAPNVTYPVPLPTQPQQGLQAPQQNTASPITLDTSVIGTPVQVTTLNHIGLAVQLFPVQYVFISPICPKESVGDITIGQTESCMEKMEESLNQLLDLMKKNNKPRDSAESTKLTKRIEQ